MPAPAPAVLVRPATTKAIVFPSAEKITEAKPPPEVPTAPASQVLTGAWTDGSTGHSRSALVGVYLPAYEELEPCCLSLSSFVDANRFVTFRLGSVGPDGQISQADSIKVTGEWRAGEDLEWLIRGVPLQRLASRSPTGLVAFRVKIWTQGILSRRWLGRTLPAAVPTPPHVERLGDQEIIVACCRGNVAEAAAQRGARSLDFATIPGAPVLGTAPPCSPPVRMEQQGPDAETLGREIIRVSACRQWGIAVALLHELKHSPLPARQAVLSQVDCTRRTALRLCVDGQREERAPPLQALERSTLTAVLGNRRPYWWTMRIDKICHRTLTFLGQVWIGMPRPRNFATSFATGRPWTAPAGIPEWEEVRWSEPQDCCGTLEMLMSDLRATGSGQLARLRMGTDTELTLERVAPGESGTFGTGSIRNPLGVPLVTANGRVAGALASGLFDRRASARLAAELEGCGPRDAAALAVACGSDPRALADDGLSPYTAALLGEDPCGLLDGLDSSLRIRILRGDPVAWAEAGRGRSGAGHADMVAAPLTRGLAVPDELAHGLLEHCFRADLPLLAVRALARVDGQRFLLPAIERAGDPQWLRAADRILCQTRGGAPEWCSGETLAYAIAQIRQGRQQFRLLLKDFLMRIRKSCDYHSRPANLPLTGGAECPICFEPLCKGTPKAFADEDGRAVCPHFLCPSCAHSYAATASSTGSWLRCPECRRSAPKVEVLPALEDDPLGWFDFLANAEGTMARSTLVRAISAMLPVDADRLAGMVESGSLAGGPPVGAEISAADFLGGGLYAWVWRHGEEYRRCTTLGPMPDLCERQDWFKYWNISGTGFLSRGEVLRAVLWTYEVSSLDTQRVADMRERVDRLWDGAAAERRRRAGHSNPNAVTLSEFSEVGGFGDLLEEAFGMDLSKGGRREQLPDVGGPAVLALSKSRPGAPPRRRRGEQAPAGELSGVTAAAAAARPQARAPEQPAAEPAQREPALAGAGVLGLLEQQAPSTSPSEMASSAANTVAAPPRTASGPVSPCPNLGCITTVDDSLDAMAVLEGLERDLALSPNRHTVISL